MSTYEGYLTDLANPHVQLVGANPLYIGDDWEDNLLAVRNRAVGGVIIPFERFRPVWTIVAGTPSAAGGELVRPKSNNSQEVSTPSTFTTGTWEVDLKWQNNDATEAVDFRFMQIDANNYYAVLNYNDGTINCDLQLINLGVPSTIINAGVWGADAAYHTLKLTRDAGGNFEVFHDEVSKGVVIDGTHNTSNLIFSRHSNNNKSASYTDNLKVY